MSVVSITPTLNTFMEERGELKKEKKAWNKILFCNHLRDYYIV